MLLLKYSLGLWYTCNKRWYLICLVLHPHLHHRDYVRILPWYEIVGEHRLMLQWPIVCVKTSLRKWNAGKVAATQVMMIKEAKSTTQGSSCTLASSPLLSRYLSNFIINLMGFFDRQLETFMGRRVPQDHHYPFGQHILVSRFGDISMCSSLSESL